MIRGRLEEDQARLDMVKVGKWGCSFRSADTPNQMICAG
jgi:hypothetical protein